MFTYKINSTGESSKKYGVCEVCKQHASEVFLQTEFKRYEFEHNHKKYEGWKITNILFGHKECLIKSRKE